MKNYLFILALVATAGSLESARGDSPAPPSTYTEVSANGKFIFVMLPRESMTEELKRYNEKHQKVVKDIRERYSKSGMYRNDGSNQPLWTVDPLDWWAGVKITDDGLQAIGQGHWSNLSHQMSNATHEDLKQIAFSIYGNGKLIRSFMINELVDNPKLMRASVSHFEWLRKSKIVNDKHQYEIDTYDGNHIIFSLETGAILSKIHKPVLQRKPEDIRIDPTTKWLGNASELKLMEECSPGLITTRTDFERVWKVLRGGEKPPELDFAKEFVWIWTQKGWSIVDVNFSAPEYEDDDVATESAWTYGNAIPGFSYAIAVFSRDRLDLDSGKVIVKQQKR